MITSFYFCNLPFLLKGEHLFIFSKSFFSIMVHIDFYPFKPLFPFKWVGNFDFTSPITLSFKIDK
jgi:hypothetical protein